MRPRFLYADHDGAFVESIFLFFLFPLPSFAQQLRPTVRSYNLNASNFSTCWFTFKTYIADRKTSEKGMNFAILPFSWLHQTDWEGPLWQWGKDYWLQDSSCSNTLHLASSSTIQQASHYVCQCLWNITTYITMISYRNCQTYCVKAKNCQLVVWTSILGSQHLSFGVPTKGKNKWIMKSKENDINSKSNLQLHQFVS